jgi:hypothetical protein
MKSRFVAYPIAGEHSHVLQSAIPLLIPRTMSTNPYEAENPVFSTLFFSHSILFSRLCTHCSPPFSALVSLHLEITISDFADVYSEANQRAEGGNEGEKTGAT